MKILIATGIFPPDIGGPATYSKLLADQLPQKGFSVDVLSFGEVRHLPKGISHCVYFFKLLRGAKNADVIFALDTVSVGLPAALVSRLSGKKLLVKIVGDYAWEQGVSRFGVTDSLDVFSKKKHGYSVPVLLFKKVETFVARTAVRIITPSLYLKKIIKNWGVSEHKIFVIYNAFTPVELSLNKEDARTSLGLTGIIVLSAGRLVSWKGFDALIDIFPEILKSHPDAKLFIVGDGPERSNLEEQIKRRHLSSSVLLLGKLPQKDLFMYVKTSDVFVLNTGYEGLSHQLLEVMSLGTPIVTTDVGGNPEVIKHGKEGILVSYNDKTALAREIEVVLKDADRAGGFVRAAEEKVRHFSREVMLENTIALLHDIKKENV